MSIILKHTEPLLTSSGPLRLVSNHVELHGLGQGTTLSNGDNVSILHGEARAAVDVNILVPLLVTLVLGNVVKVIPANDNGALHLGRDNESLKDLSTDGNVTSEGALLVDVGTFNGGIGGFNS